MKACLLYLAPVVLVFGATGCTSTPPVGERLQVYSIPAMGERVPVGPDVTFRTVGYRPGFVDPYYTGNTYRDRTLFGAPWNRQVHVVRRSHRTVIIRD